MIAGRLPNLFLGGGFKLVRQCVGKVAPGGGPLLPHTADRPCGHKGGHEGGRGRQTSHKENGKSL